VHDGTEALLELNGPPVILIGGAFNDRTTVAALAAILAPHLTAVTYDRRGRGASGDRPTYSVEAEIDDLHSVINRVGGSASLFGHSSGAVLALEAAARGLPVNRLALYDPAFAIEGTRPRPGADIADRLAAIGIPTLALTGSNSPEWPQASTRAVADTVPGARFAAIDGQDHGVLQQPDALRSLLTEFFTKGT
jgi:pimeloyl-ACP methyl ester carboxylesterase